jgi:hypothetical protein
MHKMKLKQDDVLYHSKAALVSVASSYCLYFYTLIILLEVIGLSHLGDEISKCFLLYKQLSWCKDPIENYDKNCLHKNAIASNRMLTQTTTHRPCQLIAAPGFVQVGALHSATAICLMLIFAMHDQGKPASSPLLWSIKKKKFVVPPSNNKKVDKERYKRGTVHSMSLSIHRFILDVVHCRLVYWQERFGPYNACVPADKSVGQPQQNISTI